MRLSKDPDEVSPKPPFLCMCPRRRMPSKACFGNIGSENSSNERVLWCVFCMSYFLVRMEQQYPDLDTILQRIHRRIVSSCSNNTRISIYQAVCTVLMLPIQDRLSVIRVDASYTSATTVD